VFLDALTSSFELNEYEKTEKIISHELRPLYSHIRISEVCLDVLTSSLIAH